MIAFWGAAFRCDPNRSTRSSYILFVSTWKMLLHRAAFQSRVLCLFGSFSLQPNSRPILHFLALAVGRAADDGHEHSCADLLSSEWMAFCELCSQENVYHWSQFQVPPFGVYSKQIQHSMQSVQSPPCWRRRPCFEFKAIQNEQGTHGRPIRLSMLIAGPLPKVLYIVLQAMLKAWDLAELSVKQNGDLFDSVCTDW